MPIELGGGSSHKTPDAKVRLRLADHEQRIFEIFTLSFRFSQGSDLAQSSISQWLSATGYLDDLKIPRVTPSYAYDLPVPHTHSNLAKNKPDAKRDVDNSWFDLFNARENRARLRANAVLPYMLYGIIQKDTKFQIEGRPGREVPPGESVNPDSKEDPYASHLRRYAINRHPTGHDAFNHMFGDLSALLNDPVELGSLRVLAENPEDGAITPLPGALLELKSKWEQNHPGKTFFPKQTAA